MSIDGLGNSGNLQIVDAPDSVVDRLGHHLRGDLDEVTVFPRALGPGEVELIRQLGMAGKQLCR
jgi:hypothetical protein